jgi:carboxymethylenebutenolidase
VPANDPSIDTANITFPGEGATIMAYQAKPKGDGPFPLVLVCHENQGLTDHIQDVARRLAKEGYVACAVDLLSREGGTRSISDPARIPSLLTGPAGQALPPERHVGDFQAALRHYATQPIVRSGAYGMTGFCFGGGITWRTSTKAAELKAAVPWYGPAPPSQDVPGIKAAIFAIYASDDPGVNASRDALEPALKQANVNYQFKSYPNTQHAFNNDTGPRYNQEQALVAWKDMLDWFARYVKG